MLYTCCKCGQEITDRYLVHCFAGWGYFIRFCEKCCPREYDGTTCESHDSEEEKNEA